MPKGKQIKLEQHQIDSVILRLGSITGLKWETSSGTRQTFFANCSENQQDETIRRFKKIGVTCTPHRMANFVHDKEGTGLMALKSRTVYSVYLTAFQAWKSMESDGVRTAITMNIL